MKIPTFKVIIMTILSITMITVLFHESLASATPNKTNIVALGDSITYGTGDPKKIGYIGRLKDKIKNPVIIQNFAIPKYKTNQTLDQLKSQKVIKAVQQSDYLILNIGTNDFRKSTSYSFNQIDLSEFKKGQKQYVQNLKQILVILKELNPSAPIFVFGLYDAYEDHNNSKQLNRLIINWNKQIQAVISEVDHITYVPTIDLFQGKPKTDVFSDSLHPNEKGYDILAHRLLKKMEELNEQSKINR
ncbi:GDSL-type esterase/lipase family protein [Bacillus sp. PS06]|uniref:GDSL-type esterase/lipase family protein n=1 Tax=Bacillus sp. PS06 TaxID=2764176 RepID=UPI00177E1ACF|nr:GDSL-type esterase/lipase family protein [Bacillus sp. PS06]MBD8067957.1 hypothetical protein [Bacillus sp. PS06]